MNVEAGALALAVCVMPAPAPNLPRVVAYPEYIYEILDHAGLGYSRIEVGDLPQRLPAHRLLLTVGEAKLPAAALEAIRGWVESGGAWVSVAGVLGLADLLGVRVQAPSFSGWGGGVGTLGEGYFQPVRPPESQVLAARGADLPDRFVVTEHIQRPLHFFNGLSVETVDGTVLGNVLDAHQRPTSRAALTHRRAGQGEAMFIAADIPGTVVRIQQGTAITRDGVPASDGSAPVCDGVLKSGDGAVLDWIFDRSPVPGVPGFEAFLTPAADLWRELLLRCLFQLARSRQIALGLVWLYPGEIPAIGHLSHDSDGNDPLLAEALLDVLRAESARSTWCVILPGYPADTVRAIASDGHELAMHYDTMTDPADWNEEAFEEQWRGVSALFGARPSSNKNHYLRWEGDTEFFDWLTRRGINLDQSKGASKTGEAGFNFGTCHPYFPLAPDGRRIEVLELATPTQDLDVFAPAALLGPLLESVVRAHGVLHLLFHPAHIRKPGVREALIHAIRAARTRGMAWWTAAEIDTWERARRRARWSPVSAREGGVRIEVQLPRTLQGSSILVLAVGGERPDAERLESPAREVERWGFVFHSVNLRDCAGGLYEEAQRALARHKMTVRWTDE